MIVAIILKLFFIMVVLSIATPWVMLVTTLILSTQFPSKREENITRVSIFVGLALLYIGFPALVFIL